MRGRRINAIKKRTRSPEVWALIDELDELLAYGEDDLNWHQANRDGSWPTARGYAEEILRKCDEREKVA